MTQSSSVHVIGYSPWPDFMWRRRSIYNYRNCCVISHIKSYSNVSWNGLSNTIRRSMMTRCSSGRNISRMSYLRSSPRATAGVLIFFIASEVMFFIRIFLSILPQQDYPLLQKLAAHSDHRLESLLLDPFAGPIIPKHSSSFYALRGVILLHWRPSITGPSTSTRGGIRNDILWPTPIGSPLQQLYGPG